MRSWDDYFWPGTTVLANKLGITDAGKLAAAEHVLTSAAVRDILDGVIEVPHTFDAAHLQALHQHVFGEVYDWAGDQELLQQMHHSSFPQAERGMSRCVNEAV